VEATIHGPAICYGSLGGGASMAFHHQLSAYDTDTLIGALDGLRRFLGGQKATLLWDGLPAYRSRMMRLASAPAARAGGGITAAYTPELNPLEPLWCNLKGVELANLTGDTLIDVIKAAERGVQRVRDIHHLAYSFLRHCGLSLW
jgi:hypothetical protein